jgi:lysophospholipase L1-like esterase
MSAGAGGAQANSGAGGNSGSAGNGSGTPESIHYYGRWHRQADRVTTVNSGSYIRAQFSGTGISARFDVSSNDRSDLPTVAFRIDQASTWQVAEVGSTLMMASALSGGSHSITIIARGLDEKKSRWSPPLVSSITFLGFDVTSGMLEPTVPPIQPKLEILGDSITEGVVVQGSSYLGRTGQCWKNDAVYSYPTQTGMRLGADYRQVGFGYQGLLKAGDGGVPPANDSFPWVYKDAPRDDWQADMVVINQGTNDSTQPATAFKSAYTTFVATIRKAYPNAKILALRPFSGAQEAQIKAVVSASNAAGDSRVYYVDTSGWLTPGSDFSDSLHPNVQGSGKAATKLVAEINRIGLP